MVSSVKLAARVLGLGSQRPLSFGNPAVRPTVARQWQIASRRHAPAVNRRFIPVCAQDGSSWHLASREDSDDGTILFRFSDEPATDSTTQDTPSEQAEAVGFEEPVITTAKQDEEGTEQSSDKVQKLMSSDASKDSQPSSSFDGPQQTVSHQAQQTAEPHSDQQQSELSTSSADMSEEEASGSDSNSERLWDMTPQQLEGLKVTELKELCKQEHVKGYSKLKKDQLIHLLQEQLQSR